MLALPEHISSLPPPLFSGMCVAQSLVFCVVFFCTLTAVLIVLCPSIFGIFKPLTNSNFSWSILNNMLMLCYLLAVSALSHNLTMYSLMGNKANIIHLVYVTR